jgi:hypothetical protein
VVAWRLRVQQRHGLRLSLFPQTVPKSLGSVRFPLWNPFYGAAPSHLLHLRSYFGSAAHTGACRQNVEMCIACG